MEVTRVFSLTGAKVAQTMTVKLRPGFGIQHDGQHVEGGPHTLPADIAWNLVSTNRADIVEPNAAPVAIPDEITNGDPAVEHRDPAVKTARRR